MNPRANTVLGRKVFLISPPYNVTKLVLPKLIEHEFEVYVIPTYKQAKQYLAHFPDSIVYLCIDSEMSCSGWFNFAKSFEQDSVLSTMIIGILARTISKSDRERFLIHLDLPGGLIHNVPDPITLTENLAGALDINNAKGQRKYVRANCLSDRNCTLTCTVGGYSMRLQVHDISSVGLACICSTQEIAHIPANSVVRNAILTLRENRISCNCAVVLRRDSSNHSILVMLFMRGMPNTSKLMLYNYIQHRLQAIFEAPFSTILRADTVDYENITVEEAQKQVKPLLSTYASNNGADSEILEELEQLGDQSVGK